MFAIFGLLALASKDLGKSGTWVGLPLISGFLITGVLAGPYVLDVLGTEAVSHLQAIDAFSLAFIAFAAGAEFEMAEVRRYLRDIVTILSGQVVVIMIVGATVFVMLANWLPFMQAMVPLEVIAVGLIGATIMVARSPSSAYAIIKELRAKGPVTQTLLGVTVLTDAVVIVLFAISVSLADILFEGGTFNLGLLLFLIFEIALDIALGMVVGQLLRFILSLKLPSYAKSILVLLLGYGIFSLSAFLHDVHLWSLPVGIFSEPLLIGLVAGFVVTNYTPYKHEFHALIEETAPLVLTLFFTLVGVSLELDVLASAWLITLALLSVRFVGMVTGTVLGGMLTSRSPRENAIMGMTFLTQAGISVGLAKEVSVEFPSWGQDFTTIVVAVIVVNQLIRPPILKWAIQWFGEAHLRGDTEPFDGVRDAIIFGIDDQALALARQLHGHHWQVALVDQGGASHQRVAEMGFSTHTISDITPDVLRDMQADKADAIVTLLDDDTNYAICEMAYEQFGTPRLIVRLHNRAYLDAFHALDAVIIDPSTALVSLLDHCVRSPSATALVLGQSDDQDVIEVSVGNRDLYGVALRDLRLPPDVVLMSIKRHGHLLITHGGTRLEPHDEVMLVGPSEALQEAQWHFEP